ncbi:MAG TPA: hypothetical protein VFA89_10920 [Terriglobales bacterium]|nr:hypothetical protein [Terriglobales bacterium]
MSIPIKKKAINGAQGRIGNTPETSRAVSNETTAMFMINKYAIVKVRFITPPAIIALLFTASMRASTRAG